jgi:hypothetical protein
MKTAISYILLVLVTVSITAGCRAPRSTSEAARSSSRNKENQGNPDTTPVNAAHQCQQNLRRLEKAKDQWAVGHRKTDTAIPIDADLFGSDRYIQEKPKCPSGGTYTLGTTGEHPTCSIEGHVF